MAYDEELAERIRDVLATEPEVIERAMFGGLAFLVEGHMAVAASSRGTMMVRVDPTLAESLADGHGVQVVEMRGRPMKGWLYVSFAQLRTEPDLRHWVDQSVAYVRALPPR